MNETTTLFHQSYRRGWLIFGYGLIWLAISGFGLLGQSFNAPGLLTALMVSALAGAAAGAAAMLLRLADQIDEAAEFQQQSLGRYWLQPFVGLVAGLITLLVVVIPAGLIINYLATRTLSITAIFDSATAVSLQILLAGMAGFYQWGGLAYLRRRIAKQPVSLPATAPPEEAPFEFEAWFDQRQEQTRWALSWGSAIFIYGLVWLVGLIAGLGLAPDPTGSNLLAAAWFTIAAGGIGGVVGMWSNLYQSVSFRQDFERQQVMSYVVKPPLGLFLGGAVYFFITSGYLSFKTITTDQNPSSLEVPALIAAQLVLGWLGGFRPVWLTRFVEWLVDQVIRFFRALGRALSPKNWFKASRRAEALDEFSREVESLRPN